MNTYIALLRGINVSGQKKIRMVELKKCLENLLFNHVQTYIQSGNIVFTSTQTDLREIEFLIQDQLKKEYGFDVPTIVLSLSTLKRMIDENPFKEEGDANPTKVMVTCLSSAPSPKDLDILNQLNLPSEFFEIKEKVLYGYFPNGYGKAKLSNTFLEKKLKLSATTRNWKTVHHLYALASETPL